MAKLAPNSKFIGHSTEIIGQSKMKGPLRNLISKLLLPIRPTVGRFQLHLPIPLPLVVSILHRFFIPKLIAEPYFTTGREPEM